MEGRTELSGMRTKGKRDRVTQKSRDMAGNYSFHPDTSVKLRDPKMHGGDWTPCTSLQSQVETSRRVPMLKGELRKQWPKVRGQVVSEVTAKAGDPKIIWNTMRAEYKRECVVEQNICLTK